MYLPDVEVAARALEECRLLAIGLAEHPYEHGPKDAVLLAVDQEFGEGAPRGFARFVGCWFHHETTSARAASRT